jgi:RNA polymerase sigma-70 factor (ECF subfamily)
MIRDARPLDGVLDLSGAASHAEPIRMDQASFRIFYEKTAPSLRAYIHKSCGSIDLADDILQGAFLRFLRAAPRSTDEAAMRGYLYRTADNLLIDDWRRRNREQRWSLEMLFRKETVSRRDDGDDMERAFRQLKPQQRRLLWLAYVEGMDHREIAASAGVREKSVRVLLFRARKALAAILKRAGFRPEAV